MFGNYFKAALRNFRKNKIFSLINIAGLSVGLSCFVLISLFVYNELHYDTYPTDAKDIYRVNLGVTSNDNAAQYPLVDLAVGEGMKAAFPEVKAFARLVPSQDFIRLDDKQFKEDKLAFADSNFLQMFSLQLLEGNNREALVQPNTMVISQTLAQKYFGNSDPLGKSLTVGAKGAAFKITGVFDKVPENSHFHFDAFLSLATWQIKNPTWSNVVAYTYLQLNKNADITALQAKFKTLVSEHVVPEIQHDMGVSLAEAQKSANDFIFTLQPLTKIHLYSHTKYELEPNSDIQYVYIFSALALFILLLACINFTNLSVARSLKRAREVGIRKVFGTPRRLLISQFLSESVLMTFGAMLIAIGICALVLPYFNEISGRHFTFSYLLNYRFIVALIVLLFLVGIVAGIYPAFYLSKFNPIKVLKGTSGTGNNKNVLRKGLIIFQFFISTALIIATIIVYQQLSYMQNKNLGYNKEQVLYLSDANLLGQNQDAFKQRLLQDNRVVDASISRNVPGINTMEGTQVSPVGKSGNGSSIHINIFHVDYDYLKTLGIQLKQGRYFSKDFGADSSAVVINEAAVQELGWSHTDPIGQTIIRSGQQSFKVIGVIHDFNYASAKQKVAPLMMLMGRNYGGLLIKIKTTDIAGFLNDLQRSWRSFNPNGPLTYSFLDETFATLYAHEIRIQKIFSAFALIALIIASLGLFGLSAFMLERRMKEIGIRKVLGASVQNVFLLVSGEFLSLVFIALLFAIPVTWWTMHNWLNDYAYRIQISAWVFLIAGVLALLIALVTISFQSVKAAIADPVKSLRAE